MPIRLGGEAEPAGETGLLPSEHEPEQSGNIKHENIGTELWAKNIQKTIACQRVFDMINSLFSFYRKEDEQQNNFPRTRQGLMGRRGGGRRGGGERDER